MSELPFSARRFYFEEYWLRRRPRWQDAPPMEGPLERFAGPPGRALDVGCGTGRHALFLASRGHRVVGLDLSWRALRLARRGVRAHGLEDRIELVRGRASRIEKIPGPFDLALDVLAAASDLEGARLERYARGLGERVAPQGRLLIFTFEGPQLLRRFSDFELVEQDASSAAGSWFLLRRKPKPSSPVGDSAPWSRDL